MTTMQDAYDWLLGELIDEARLQGCEWASPECRFYTPYGFGEVRLYPPEDQSKVFLFNRPWMERLLQPPPHPGMRITNPEAEAPEIHLRRLNGEGQGSRPAL